MHILINLHISILKGFIYFWTFLSQNPWCNILLANCRYTFEDLLTHKYEINVKILPILLKNPPETKQTTCTTSVFLFLRFWKDNTFVSDHFIHNVLLPRISCSWFLALLHLILKNQNKWNINLMFLNRLQFTFIN